MSKNIILTSDGTGNKGGQGADTNVFKTYLAVSLAASKTNQVAFHDDGVGNDKNKILRGISGALGVGLSDNVKEIYAFLCRNYEPGDRIYLFGFSRGAATVRTLAGLIIACGVIDGKSPDSPYLHDHDLQNKIDDAMKVYQKWEKHENNKGMTFQNELEVNACGYANVPIHFVGVWDTVSALGFPTGWPWYINWFANVVRWLMNKVSPHTFHDFQLNHQVHHAYHAIAIDDERKTFHPLIWDETAKRKPKYIEQVWFSGAHSNVGGGYPKCGLSNVALEWMMVQAAQHGLDIEPTLHLEANRDVNANDKLYNSRDGLAVYYRFAPRQIQELCKDKLLGNIKIHESVVNRLKHRTGRYAPAFIPDQFDVVDNGGNWKAVNINANLTQDERTEVDRWVGWRKKAYEGFIFLTLLLIVLGASYSMDADASIKVVETNFLSDFIAHYKINVLIANSGIPGAQLILDLFASMPSEVMVPFVIVLILLIVGHKRFRANGLRARENLREEILKNIPSSSFTPPPAPNKQNV